MYFRDSISSDKIIVDLDQMKVIEGNFQLDYSSVNPIAELKQHSLKVDWLTFSDSGRAVHKISRTNEEDPRSDDRYYVLAIKNEKKN